MWEILGSASPSSTVLHYAVLCRVILGWIVSNSSDFGWSVLSWNVLTWALLPAFFLKENRKLLSKAVEIYLHTVFCLLFFLESACLPCRVSVSF